MKLQETHSEKRNPSNKQITNKKKKKRIGQETDRSPKDVMGILEGQFNGRWVREGDKSKSPRVTAKAIPSYDTSHNRTISGKVFR